MRNTSPRSDLGQGEPAVDSLPTQGGLKNGPPYFPQGWIFNTHPCFHHLPARPPYLAISFNIFLCPPAYTLHCSTCISRPFEGYFWNIFRLGGDQVIPAFLQNLPEVDSSLLLFPSCIWPQTCELSSMFLLLALAWLDCICLVDRTSNSSSI